MLSAVVCHEPYQAWASLLYQSLPLHGVDSLKRVNPIWHWKGYFYPLVLFRSDFVSLILFKILQTFFE